MEVVYLGRIAFTGLFSQLSAGVRSSALMRHYSEAKASQHHECELIDLLNTPCGTERLQFAFLHPMTNKAQAFHVS